MADVAANPPAFGKAEPHMYPWWLILIEGLAAILLGIFFFTTPAVTTLTVAWFVAIYWIITGIVACVSLFWDRTQWGWRLLWGVVSIVAGWYILGNLIMGTAVLLWTFLFILGFQGLMIGIVEIIQAAQGAGWGRGILGVVSALFGGWIIYLAFQKPGAAIAVLPWVFGTFAIIGGIAVVFFSFQVRGMEKSGSGRTAAAA